MWDVGVIPDSAFKDDGKPVTRGPSTVTRTLRSQLAEIGYRLGHHLSRPLPLSRRSHRQLERVRRTLRGWCAKWSATRCSLAKPPALVDPKDYSDLKNSKTIILTKDEYDVFGDGKVIIKSAPGHTPGHQVVILKLAKTGPVMLAGDLYHYPEERKLNRVPTFEYNKEQSLASRAMIEDYCKKTGTQLWIEHDYVHNSKLKKSPQYYD